MKNHYKPYSSLIIEFATSDISINLLLKDRITYLKSFGYNIIGLSSNGPHAEKLKKEGIPLDTIKIKREISIFNDITTLFLLIKYFKKKKPAIVFSHTPKAGIIGPVAARFAGVPKIVHVVHGYLIHDKAPFFQKILGWIIEKHTALWSHLCLSQSKEDIEKGVYYRIISKKRHKYLGNGIDVERFNPTTISQEQKNNILEEYNINNNKFKIGFAGRLVKEKGFREINYAIKKLSKLNNELVFIIIGPEEPEQSDSISKEQIEEMKKNYGVVFTGFFNDMPKILSILDLFVLPTYREGIPRALMEACAMQVPCLSTNIRGCREVIINDKTGWLINPRDPKGLTKSILKIYSLVKSERLKIGQNAREHIINNFNERRINKRFLRICNILLKKQTL